MNNFKKFKTGMIIGVISFCSILAIALILIAFLVKLDLAYKHLLIGLSLMLLILMLIFCIRIDQESGIFICPKCGKEFTPTIKEYSKGLHNGTTRKLKCPHCGEVNFCIEKKVRKDEK